MQKIEILNPIQHKNLSVNQTYHSGIGYDLGAVMIVPSEIRDVQREYPILFRKHFETGRLFPNALLGFAEKENLFLHDSNGWQAEYIPLSIKKGPFLISFEDQEEKSKPVLSINLDDPRISSSGDNPLFNSQNQPTSYLQEVNNALGQMHEGATSINAMINAFNEADLIEPVTLNIQLNNAEDINFSGAYTIAEEKLLTLSSDLLEKLNASGWLSAAYYISGSLGNISRLVNFKNKRLP